MRCHFVQMDGRITDILSSELLSVKVIYFLKELILILRIEIFGHRPNPLTEHFNIIPVLYLNFAQTLVKVR